MQTNVHANFKDFCRGPLSSLYRVDIPVDMIQRSGDCHRAIRITGRLLYGMFDIWPPIAVDGRLDELRCQVGCQQGKILVLGLTSRLLFETSTGSHKVT